MSTRKEVEDVDAAEAFNEALSGSLHQETRVFDFGRPDLSSGFDCQMVRHLFRS